MDSIRGKVAIVGVGEVPTGMYPERSFIEAAVEVSEQAIKDANIKKEDIETVLPIVVVANQLDMSNMVCSWLVEELGLGKTCKNNFMICSGGSSSTTALKTAIGLITNGLSKAVLVVHSDRLGTGIDIQSAILSFSKVSINQEYEAPYGFSQLAMGAFLQNRYMHQTGTTQRQVAAVVESLRKWASLNPNAMIRTVKSADEIVNCDMLSTPLTKRMMNKLADGAAAFIVTSAERAKDMTDTPAYILGQGSRCTHFTASEIPEDIEKAWGPATDEAYEMAGITEDDIKVAEIYDAFPSSILLQLNLLKLCAMGEAGAFVEDGNIAPGGKMPCTTNGGLLAQGHTGCGGGVTMLVEAYRQLTGKAGERQVKDADIAVATALGGNGMDYHVGVLGREV